MRTISINLYQFEELSDAAKDKARDWFRSVDDGDAWGYEWQDSLKLFCEYFSLTTDSWEVSTHAYSHCKVTARDDDIENLTGLRAWKWLANNGHFKPELLSGNCPFTGYCGDEDLLDPIRTFRDKPDLELTLGELFQQCADAWVKAWVADMEYARSDD